MVWRSMQGVSNSGCVLLRRGVPKIKRPARTTFTGLKPGLLLLSLNAALEAPLFHLGFQELVFAVQDGLAVDAQSLGLTPGSV
jgi:hypothetical protein